MELKQKMLVICHLDLPSNATKFNLSEVLLLTLIESNNLLSRTHYRITGEIEREREREL
jgi:hypothetical protein